MEEWERERESSRSLWEGDRGRESEREREQQKHYDLCANQCKVLENALRKTLEYAVVPKFSAQHLLDDCSAGKKLSWLEKALRRVDGGREDFSLALGELLCFASTIWKFIARYTTNPGLVSLTKEAEGLVHFLQSAKEDLRSAAAEDRNDLLARVEKIIESPSDYEDNDVSRAQFLQRVWMASTKKDEKKARLISPDDLTFGNTLGRGASAKVYEVSWMEKGGYVVKENKVSRYHDIEVDNMLGIKHPNVMHMIGHSSEEPYQEGINVKKMLLMEKMEGHLDGFILEHSLKDPGQAINILIQIARGMKYLHENKIVHCDLKPANILHDGLENFKIADFGSSRSPFDHRTMATAPIGTDMYMAPELLGARGNRDLDTSMYGPEVDIYSFGMIGYKVITGQDPLLAWRDVLEGKRPPLKASAQCPQALVSFIQKCWDKDPDQRPSAAQVYEFLILFKCIGLLTTPAHKTSCLSYGITDTLLEKLVSFLGKEWLETEARALEEGTSEEDLKLHKQVTDFLSRSKKSCFQQIRDWCPFF